MFPPLICNVSAALIVAVCSGGQIGLHRARQRGVSAEGTPPPSPSPEGAPAGSGRGRSQGMSARRWEGCSRRGGLALPPG